MVALLMSERKLAQFLQNKDHVQNILKSCITKNTSKLDSSVEQNDETQFLKCFQKYYRQSTKNAQYQITPSKLTIYIIQSKHFQPMQHTTTPGIPKQYRHPIGMKHPPHISTKPLKKIWIFIVVAKTIWHTQNGLQIHFD